ncbi:MAG: hypothetical protein QRY72_00175 [Candidatus Rhabdochlamydia sp.]
MTLLYGLKSLYFAVIPPTFHEAERERRLFSLFNADYDKWTSLIMKDVQVPTPWISIFDPYKLLVCKESFRYQEFLEENITEDSIFNNLVAQAAHLAFKDSLEGYHVDQHLSYKVPIESVDKMFLRIEEAVQQHRFYMQQHAVGESNQNTVDEGYFSSDRFPSCNEINGSDVLFVKRIVSRIVTYFEKDGMKKMPLPQFDDPRHQVDIQRLLKPQRTYSLISLYNPSAEDQHRYHQFKEKFYHKLDERVLNWMKTALKADFARRELNDQVLLTHLTTVPALDQKIKKTFRRSLYRILVTLVVMGIFYSLMKDRSLIGHLFTIAPHLVMKLKKFMSAPMQDQFDIFVIGAAFQMIFNAVKIMRSVVALFSKQGVHHPDVIEELHSSHPLTQREILIRKFLLRLIAIDGLLTLYSRIFPHNFLDRMIPLQVRIFKSMNQSLLTPLLLFIAGMKTINWLNRHFVAATDQ